MLLRLQSEKKVARRPLLMLGGYVVVGVIRRRAL